MPIFQPREKQNASTSTRRQGGKNNMDNKIMRTCYDLPANFDCDICPENIGATRYLNDSGEPGPCGQQNCWYSCTVCRYNSDTPPCEDKKE